MEKAMFNANLENRDTMKPNLTVINNKTIQTIFDKADCIHDLKTIENALDQMATDITKKLKNENPLVICVMIGALIPGGHLLTRLNFPLEVDYIHATRYRNEIRGGDLHWLVEPRQSLENRTILLVDDIMDGGLTLSAIIDYCKQAGAKEVYSAVIVNKIRQREPGVNFEPDFIGLDTEDRFLFGFGLDYKGYLRNAPGIYAVAKEHETL
jgi:hypoxanthine phosphoribosyltransferase